MSTPRTQGEAIAVLSTQMLELSERVALLRGDLQNHRAEHERAVEDRRAARRRLWGAVVVLVASIDGPLVAFMITRR